MTQSADLITSKLCSMTSTEWPACDEPLKDPQQHPHVLEMQPRRRLIKYEKCRFLGAILQARLASARPLRLR